MYQLYCFIGNLWRRFIQNQHLGSVDTVLYHFKWLDVTISAGDRFLSIYPYDVNVADFSKINRQK